MSDMRAADLEVVQRRGLRDMQENMEILLAGNDMSYDMFMESVEKFFDAAEALRVFRRIENPDPDMTVDDIMYVARVKRAEKEDARRKAWFDRHANKIKRNVAKIFDAMTAGMTAASASLKGEVPAK